MATKKKTVREILDKIREAAEKAGYGLKDVNRLIAETREQKKGRTRIS